MSSLRNQAKMLRAIAKDLDRWEREVNTAAAAIKEGAEWLRNPGDGCAVVRMHLDVTTGHTITKFTTGKGVDPYHLLAVAIDGLTKEWATLSECPVHKASGK